MSKWKVECCNCLEGMQRMEAASVDAIVTDPPYGLAFMGKKWDYDVPRVEIWRECLRVLKPGGHLLAFAGTRTQHRMAVNIEDSGFEIRDMIAWVYGSGFPKSHNVGKAIDAACGAQRDVIGKSANKSGIGNKTAGHYTVGGTVSRHTDITAPATDAAKQWDGWGTALKPAMEPITVARKPLDGTVAANVLTHGTGAINVDGCRVGTNGGVIRIVQAPYAESGCRTGHEVISLNAGRWPANLIHDGGDEVVGLLNDAARFFYCAKASRADRDEGLESMPLRECGALSGRADGSLNVDGMPTMGRNNHPTVKPTELMRYLCRLVTPPNGLILDPFTGSGSTGKAAMLEGFRFIGFEMSPDYVEIARARIASAVSAKALF